MIDRTIGFTLERTLDATVEQVWKAWTDPDSIAQWWHSPGASTPRESAEVDLRVGGHYQYAMVDGDFSVVTGGVYVEIVPHERLVFTWGIPDAEPDDTPMVTVTLKADGDRTRMMFDLRGVEGSPDDGFYYDGWAAVFQSLEDFLLARGQEG